ncbi:MAG: MarR family transcriptional regulator [Firmicutes bacterium]|nr:MarR family transcriptional regulator [Bacillota bacterium]
MMNNTILMKQLNQFYAVWQEYNYVYQEWAKKHGVSVNSLLVLSAIYEGQDTCTQKKISQRWLIPKQTINMVLKDFEKKGLVELLPVEEDKRNKRIRFTKEGQEYADTIVSQLRKVEMFVAEKMGMEQMKQLNDSMTQFVELFSKAGERESCEPKE